MSLFGTILRKERTMEAPEAIWVWVDTHLAAPAVSTVLDGWTAPKIYEIPEDYTHTHIWWFEWAGDFYFGTDSVWTEENTMYMW